MKNLNWHFLQIMLIVFFALSCSDDEVIKEEENPLNFIQIEELTGTYKVTDYLIYKTTENPVKDESKIGNFWQIEEKNISIDCSQKASFSYSNNVITSNGVRYRINKENDKLIVTFISGSKTEIYLEPTTEACPDEGEEKEEEKPITGNVELDKLYGYAEGTTGGQGATEANTHHFDNGKKFTEWLKLREKNKSEEPAIVWLSGTFTKEDGRDSSSPWFDIKRTNNISIYGTNSFKMENVGFFLNGANNIIIRNIYIKMPKADNGADGISMQASSKVWIDHCTFESMNQTSDYEDGSCDITHATKQVTVSWNHFIKTQKTALVGHSNSATADAVITATFHHNYFDKSSSRHPRVRFGKVHVYNNFYNGVTTYGVGSAYEAKVLVEYNNFDAVHLPTDICTFPAKKSGSSWVSNLTGSKAGYLYERDNTFTNKPSNSSDPYPFVNTEYIAYNGEKLSTPLIFNDFKPEYEYILDDSEKINEIVPSGAGVGKLPNFETAPIDVNNGNITGGNEGGGENPTPDPDPEEGKELGGGWYALNIGDADGTNSISTDNKAITMTGKGKFESGKQEFSYVYREITGDFEITVSLDDYTTASSSNQSEAGLLFTPDITTTGNDFMHALSGKGGNAFNYSHRISVANSSKGGLDTPTTSGGKTYLKLRRVGNNYYSSYSLDGGITYGKESTKTFTIELPNKLYVGLVVNSGSTSQTATAIFSDLKINGIAYLFGD